VSETPRARRLAEALLLFRTADRRLDAAATCVVVLLLVWSRFGLMACGPWEWDEVIFARGILDFNLAAHFPHPPGFPGWLAIGHLLLPVAGTPLAALQLGSAVLSVVALWPLAALGRRVSPPPVAVAAALLVLFAPGPWLHAARGFSSTPATTFALLAAALAVGGLRGHRATAFTVLVAVALLVRPILLPGLGTLWLAVALGVRPWRRLLPGVTLAILMVVGAITLMAIAEGGWREFVAPFVTHAGRYLPRLAGNTGGWPQLGLVKGLGGSVAAAVLAIASVLGVTAWARKVGVRVALLWLAVLTTTVVQLVVVQNRTYARYAVPVQLGLAPLVAGAAAAAPPAVATAGLLAATGWLAVRTYPLVDEQHRRPAPGWRAVQVAATEASRLGAVVVVEPELYPFASYHWHVSERRGETMPRLVLSPWAPEPWQGVDRPYLVATVHRPHYLRSTVDQELSWGGISDALRPLTQQRFLDSWVITAPPLNVGEWWPAEQLPHGERFMWGGADCGLVLPPLPAGTAIALRVRPAPGEQPLRVKVNDIGLAELPGNGGEAWVKVSSDHVRHTADNTIRFVRGAVYPPGTDDHRPLAVQLLDLRLTGSGVPWTGSLVNGDERAALGLELFHHYYPESFGDAGPGVWLAPRAGIEAAVGAGQLALMLSAPRPEPPATRLSVRGQVVAGPLDLGAAPIEVVVPINEGDLEQGVVRIEVESSPYVPAEAGHGADRRELGVVVSSVRFAPLEAPLWVSPLDGSQRGCDP
jgi:hypothetical protein